MILSDLMAREVRCGDERLGHVIDARFVVRGAVEGSLAEAQLVGLVVGPKRRMSVLGYERAEQDRPALLNWFFGRRQRESFLVDWDDVASVDGDAVELREGFTRWSSRLR
ncbi:hypothetical protein [Aeromicrobium terrae]|nr:hypothetical protein [Aeromicrobium terrae]